MGAIEEGGKVASGIVDALKHQPLVLALIVINVMFLAATVWLFGSASVRKDKLISALATRIASCQCPLKDR
jgi:hypothetical protein